MSVARTSRLILAMVLAVAAVAALAFWDERREAALQLAEFANEQAALAVSVAASLEGRSAAHAIERTGEREVFLLPPGARTFETWDGKRAAIDEVLPALDSGASIAPVTAEIAGRLGLPLRSAWAGLAKAGKGGWAVAVIATARRDRDRARRGMGRLLLSTALAAGLVLAFGGLALRERGRELEASRSLAIAELEREREGRLEREDKAATVITLASGVAHEVATPLGVIIGRAEQVLPRVADDERAVKSVQAIIEQADRIREVLRGFLSLARGVPPALARLDPRAVVEGALGLVEHRFSKAGVKLQPELEAGLPPIRCDQRLLEHALVNLLLNACDASPRGGSVEIRAQRLGAGIEFAVRDEGQGISPEVAARAAEPFFTTKPADRGTGLGLAIASEIAKTHHGTLSIAPGADRGTRVSVQIPVEQ